MKKICALVIGSVSLLAQDGTPVNISISAPLTAYSNLYFYSGTDLVYGCRAKSIQPTATFSVSGSTPFVLTSIVVLTNVGTVTTVSDHGLAIGDKVVVSGGTVDTDLNATYAIATVPTSKTFTITTVAVSNNTYNNAALQFTTTAPRDTAAIWSITKYTYVSNAVTAIKWANGTSSPNQICANRATLAFQ